MGTVKLSGLNDYLRPSPDCILPINNRADSFEVTLRNEKKKDRPKNEPVKVTLSDCLSCSGCLTSSEPLLENNFYLEVVKNLFNSKCSVISLSTQSILSLCTLYDLSFKKTVSKLKIFFNAKGVKYVFNQSLAEAIHLEETKKEFEKAQRSNRTLICSNCPGWVIYAEKSLDKSFLLNMSRLIPLQALQGILVKFLVCIKNKVEYNKLHYRNLFSASNYFKLDSVAPSEIYHVCVTPCHDKKLESVRPDLVANFTELANLLQIEDGEASSVRLVDAVITTSELKEVLNGDINFSDDIKEDEYEESNLFNEEDLELLRSILLHKHSEVIPSGNSSPVGTPPLWEPRFPPPSSIGGGLSGSTPGSSDKGEGYPEEREATLKSEQENVNLGLRHSGGYAEGLVTYLHDKHLGQEINEVRFENISNRHYQQAVLKNDKGVIKVSIATGYRNIANVVSNTTSNSKADYVELMACPGGCVNGGGQLKGIEISMKYDDRVCIRSDKLKAVVELEAWLWKEIGRLVKRGKNLLTMELTSIKETRTDW